MRALAVLIALLALPASASAVTIHWEGVSPFTCRFGEAGASYACSPPLELMGLEQGNYLLVITGADGTTLRKNFTIKPDTPATPQEPALPPARDGTAGRETVFESTPLNPLDIPPTRMVTWGGVQNIKKETPRDEPLLAAAGILAPLPVGIALWSLFGIALTAALGWFFYRPKQT